MLNIFEDHMKNGAFKVCSFQAKFNAPFVIWFLMITFLIYICQNVSGKGLSRRTKLILCKQCRPKQCSHLKEVSEGSHLIWSLPGLLCNTKSRPLPLSVLVSHKTANDILMTCSPASDIIQSQVWTLCTFWNTLKTKVQCHIVRLYWVYLVLHL